MSTKQKRTEKNSADMFAGIVDHSASNMNADIHGKFNIKHSTLKFDLKQDDPLKT